MKPRILLINPWIHDFAAYNLWSRPLGLLAVAEFLTSFDADLRFIDCMESFRPGRYGTGKYRAEVIPKPDLLRRVPRRYKRYGIGIDEFTSRLESAAPFDIVLITSIMSYWYPGVEEVVARVRQKAGTVPVVLGGIYPALYPEHAARCSGADLIFRGPVDDSLLPLLARAGITLKHGSPPKPVARLDLYPNAPFAPLLTSRGCPYQCSYCASRMLHPGYQRKPVHRVMEELRWWHDRAVSDFAFYDDALLYEPDQHIKPLLQEVLNAGLSVRLHAPNGLHARFIDDDLARLMKDAGFTTLRLSLETVDPVRQKRTGGKISTQEFAQSVRCLQKQGFRKEHIGVYLLYGLPGQRLQEVEAGVDYLTGLGVRIMLAEFSPIPGTAAWTELVGAGVISNDFDPLLSNNTVFSLLYSDYDQAAVDTLKLRVKEYNAAS